MSATFTTSGPKWCNLNGSHGNHHAHQNLMNEWKDRAAIAARAAGCEPVTPPVTITATVHRTTNAKADAHNVTPTIKACIDAAVEVGIIPDDHDGIVSRLIIEPGPKMPAPTVELRIETTPIAHHSDPADGGYLPPVYRGLTQGSRTA